MVLKVPHGRRNELRYEGTSLVSLNMRHSGGEICGRICRLLV